MLLCVRINSRWVVGEKSSASLLTHRSSVQAIPVTEWPFSFIIDLLSSSWKCLTAPRLQLQTLFNQEAFKGWTAGAWIWNFIIYRSTLFGMHTIFNTCITNKYPISNLFKESFFLFHTIRSTLSTCTSAIEQRMLRNISPFHFCTLTTRLIYIQRPYCHNIFINNHICQIPVSLQHIKEPNIHQRATSVPIDCASLLRTSDFRTVGPDCAVGILAKFRFAIPGGTSCIMD